MKVEQACVLVSGGMDSVAALAWAKRSYSTLLAVLVDYGQPNRDQELIAAGRACRALEVTALRIAIADGLPRGRGILRAVQDHDGRDDGTSPAFVTGRNILFATCAAAHACEHFTNGNLALVLGCNAQDARRFPDCHPHFITKMGECLRVGLGREVQVVAPWIDRTKEQLLRALTSEDRALVASSWSCYRDSGPCGRCGACVLRREAFDAVGLVDACAAVKMFGGDPAREWS